jgi:DNA-binding beta-propeller fold protein YncE
MRKLLPEEKMKKRQAVLMAIFFLFAVKVQCAATAPLKLIDRYKFPSDVKGTFHRFIADVRGHRLFCAAQQHKSVVVFDLKTGKLIHTIDGIVPSAIFYRQDLDRLYVTDGGEGGLKIFDGKTYDLIKTVKLLPDSDAIAYDSKTQYLYAVNGGGDAKIAYSMVSVIDTTHGEKIADIKIDGDALKAMALDTSSPRIYVNNQAKSQVEVIDRNTRTVIASWPVTLAKLNFAIALDEAHHRLFVGCRDGQIVVFDTETGKELQALPINKGIDDLEFHSASKRLYAACAGGDGSVDVYEEIDPDHYKSLGSVPSGPGARSGRLVPELKRYFVEAPQHGSTDAEVLVYKVQ